MKDLNLLMVGTSEYNNNKYGKLEEEMGEKELRL
jgi:hypothetical protein